MTYNLEMEVKELQAKISDPTAPKTIEIAFYAIDGDSSNIDLSFSLKIIYGIGKLMTKI